LVLGVLLWNALFFFFSSRRRHTRLVSDWSSDVCSSDLASRRVPAAAQGVPPAVTAVRPLHCRSGSREPVAQAGSCTFTKYRHTRSEERRVGKECRFRWWGDRYEKKEYVDEV